MNEQRGAREGRCDYYAELASAYLDDQLHPLELEALAGHLKECGPCRDGLQGFVGIRTTLRREDALRPQVLPGPEFFLRVREALEKERPPVAAALPAFPRRERSLWYPLAAGMVAAVLLLAMAALSGQLGGWPASPHRPGEGVARLEGVSPAVRDDLQDVLAKYLEEHARQAGANTLVDNSDAIRVAAWRGSGEP
jgi:hypothetical protein